MNIVLLQFPFNELIPASVDAANDRQYIFFIHIFMLDLSKKGVKQLLSSGPKV